MEFRYIELTISEKRSSLAFPLSLVGGMLIIFGSILSLLFFANFQISPMGGMRGGMMGWWGGARIYG